MNRAKLGLAAAALLAGAGGASAAVRDPSGTWLTQDGRARIRLEKCGASRQLVCGYVVWIKPGTAKSTVDRFNPDPAKATRPVLGHQLLAGLSVNDNDRYAGQIYNSEDGKSYDVEVWTDSPTDLKLKGCLVAFLCSTQNWTRVEDVVPGQLAGATGSPSGPQPDAEWASKPATAGSPKRDAKPKS